MNCPQCHSPMKPVKTPGLVRTIAGICAGEHGARPCFRCPKCYTEVISPMGDGFVQYIENLEDYRKSCLSQVSVMQSTKGILGDLSTDVVDDRLSKLQRFVRILDAMTLEERLHSDRIGPDQRQRIATDSFTTLDDMDHLLKGFAEERDLYQEQGKKLVASIALWLAVVIPPLLVGIGARVLAEFNSVAAFVLSFLGYYLVSAVLMFLGLTRVKAARGLVFSSWPRSCAFLFVIPAVVAAGLFYLIHHHVVQAGLEYVAVNLGCVVVLVLAVAVEAVLMPYLAIRNRRRGNVQDIRAEPTTAAYRPRE